MARPDNYLFCRYQLAVGDDVLSARAQLVFLQDNQGQEAEHGRFREGAQPSALWTSPEVFEVDGFTALTFLVGYKPGVRSRQRYNRATTKVERQVERDDHTKLSRIILVPDLGAMAVHDKTSDDHLPARSAISAFKSVVRYVTEDDGALDVVHASDADVRKALDQWNLTEYLYTVKPLNPIPGTPLSRRRSDAYKRENVGKEIGRVYPKDGERMHAEDGVIAETRDLAEDGYGQVGLRGKTPDGHRAHIPKPRFFEERTKNLEEREKPRFLRVQIEDDPKQDHFAAVVARALLNFYA